MRSVKIILFIIGLLILPFVNAERIYVFYHDSGYQNIMHFEEHPFYIDDSEFVQNGQKIEIDYVNGTIIKHYHIPDTYFIKREKRIRFDIDKVAWKDTCD